MRIPRFTQLCKRAHQAWSSRASVSSASTSHHGRLRDTMGNAAHNLGQIGMHAFVVGSGLRRMATRTMVKSIEEGLPPDMSPAFFGEWSSAQIARTTLSAQDYRRICAMYVNVDKLAEHKGFANAMRGWARFGNYDALLYQAEHTHQYSALHYLEQLQASDVAVYDPDHEHFRRMMQAIHLYETHAPHHPGISHWKTMFRHSYYMLPPDVRVETPHRLFAAKLYAEQAASTMVGKHSVHTARRAIRAIDENWRQVAEEPVLDQAYRAIIRYGQAMPGTHVMQWHKDYATLQRDYQRKLVSPDVFAAYHLHMCVDAMLRGKLPVAGRTLVVAHLTIRNHELEELRAAAHMLEGLLADDLQLTERALEQAFEVLQNQPGFLAHQYVFGMLDTMRAKIATMRSPARTLDQLNAYEEGFIEVTLHSRGADAMLLGLRRSRGRLV